MIFGPKFFNASPFWEKGSHFTRSKAIWIRRNSSVSTTTPPGYVEANASAEALANRGAEKAQIDPLVVQSISFSRSLAWLIRARLVACTHSALHHNTDHGPIDPTSVKQRKRAVKPPIPNQRLTLLWLKLHICFRLFMSTITPGIDVRPAGPRPCALH